MEKIILVGGGGHCRVVIETILKQKKYRIAGIIDLPDKIGEEVLSLPVIGCDKDLGNFFKKGIKNCFISLGSVGDPALRIKLALRVKRIGYCLPNIIHPDSSVSGYASLGEGVYIGCNAAVNPGAVIGDNCIINTGAIVEHDCKLGDFVHIASGAVLSGGVTVGKNSHIGTGSCVIGYLKIGQDTVIGAGSVVVKSIGDKSVAFGTPCRRIRKNAR
ncbi:MAG: acetyltransferase [Candidatus Omnitrophica bacterium]|nr:acetyltransferase [Candidatus Omnitrophota bacterium]